MWCQVLKPGWLLARQIPYLRVPTLLPLLSFCCLVADRVSRHLWQNNLNTLNPCLAVCCVLSPGIFHRTGTFVFFCLGNLSLADTGAIGSQNFCASFFRNSLNLNKEPSDPWVEEHFPWEHRGEQLPPDKVRAYVVVPCLHWKCWILSQQVDQRRQDCRPLAVFGATCGCKASLASRGP